MQKKQMLFKTKGMNQDLSVSAFNPEFAFENMNLRLSTNEGNTMMSWVNERGTKEIQCPVEIPEYWSKEGEEDVYVDPEDESWTHHDATTTLEDITFAGTPIGTAVLNHKLVVFTTSNTDPDTSSDNDYIYVLEYVDAAKTQMQFVLYNGNNYFYKGNLNFCTKNPLETLVSYEAENIQKVYWVDGRNQPRVINLEDTNIKAGVDTQFDFVPTLQLNETITVKKIHGGNGMFAPGVIQYAFTYYNKNGQESNIFYTTPLYYISHRDRGASPEDKVDNAFQITIDDVDTNFEYIRIYSIQRTSINATPICKKIQDIPINNLEGTKVSYTDTGLNGDSIDPTELLYKGGSVISASTLEQKDGTLFFGNLTLQENENEIEEDTFENVTITTETRKFIPTKIMEQDYIYHSQLTSYDADGNSIPCAGFKFGDVYRLGLQFQDKWGRWSKPFYIGNKQITGSVPKLEKDTLDNIDKVTVPIFKGTLPPTLLEKIPAEYKKVRAVAVFPDVQDRLTICQGVINPTLYTEQHRSIDNNIYAQSSWFFRPYISGNSHVDTKGAVEPKSFALTGTDAVLEYTKRNIATDSPDTGALYNPKSPSDIREVEIQGEFDANSKFKIDKETVTFHSPELEFDIQMASLDYSGFKYRKASDAWFSSTLSDIDIQTETPTASGDGSGFTHKSFVTNDAKGIVSGLFYDDYLINDTNDFNKMGAYDDEHSSVKWMVYLWNKTGSLNNDINRPVDEGVATAKLKKKVISNLRYAKTDPYSSNTSLLNFGAFPTLFNSDEQTIIKLSGNGNKVYMGNIDTALNPDKSEGMYFVFNDTNITKSNITNKFIDNSELWWKTFYDEVISEGEVSTTGTLFYFDNSAWNRYTTDFFEKYLDCGVKKDLVRMKYKSTPHLVFTLNSNDVNSVYDYASNSNRLPILEIRREVSDFTKLFGGESRDALMENTWIPCGEPVSLDNLTTYNEGEENEYQAVDFYYSYGDTYYQRYDCLKTYAYTPEDENQVVEIGSFMLETRVNIDGRYDRNRGQINNLNMSPRNFNLMNPVYSQVDNFFSYKILNEDTYKNNYYPNQITWSKNKESGADVDLWTNITLASILELDGDKGEITSIKRLNDNLICFQDRGISRILYNEKVQVTTTSGVPLELANSDKVTGKIYLSDTVGCSNKWSIVSTPAGIYFMDSNEKSIYRLGEGLTNVSLQGGFNSWCKLHIPSGENRWNPIEFNNFVGYYDKKNQDVLYINSTEALAFSEKMNAFTSFYDYGKTPFFCNLDDAGIWINKSNDPETEDISFHLWKHQAGDYCDFFDATKPYWMTLVGNPEPQTDKIFTNLEFRACVDGEGAEVSGRYEPFVPFNSLKTWNEYQEGIIALSIKNGHSLFRHGGDDSALIRKFRIWRCDIPRNNMKSTHKQDRMRNPWLYLKLMKEEDTNKRTEVHDIVMTYFN